MSNQYLLAQDIDFTITYNDSNNNYEVFGRADFSKSPFFVGGGSQLSIVLPASIADSPLIISSVNGGPWADNSQIYAPAITPSVDYHGVATNGTFMSWVSGVEVLLFTFSIPNEDCVPGIRLFENNTDPSSAEGSMNGADFKNYFADVFTFIDHYRSNYNNLGIDCDKTNDPPVITAIDPQDIPQDSLITICTSFSDPNIGDTFSTSICNELANGIAGVTITDGEICMTYTPDSDFFGNETVCVQVCDQNNVCAETQVVITVTPEEKAEVNDPPIIKIIDPQEIQEDSVLTLCVPFSDPNIGDTFSAAVCNEVDNGTANLSVISGQVCLTYTPNPDFFGKETVCIQVCDQDGVCDETQVAITITPVEEPEVNHPPVITSIDPQEIPENSVHIVCALFSDLNIGDTFSASVCKEVNNGIANVSVLTGQVCLRYTPNPNFFGNETVCIQVCDQDGACDETAIAITITPVEEPEVNNPPVITSIDPQEISEDSLLTICVPFSDPNIGDTFSASVCKEVDNGTANVSVLTGQVCLTYTPNPDFFGNEMVCIQVCDQDGACAETEVAITIIPIEEPEVNYPPILEEVTPKVIEEDEAITICTPFTDQNITDTHRALLCSNPENGTADLSIVDQELCLIYQPDIGFIGEETFCLAVCDQIGICDSTTIIITAISGSTPVFPNNPPTITSIPVQEVSAYTLLNFCTTIADPNSGDVLTTSICELPTNGTIHLEATQTEACLTYTPAIQFTGLDQVCLRVCDQVGACTEMTIPIRVNPPSPPMDNTPPSINTISVQQTKQDSAIYFCAGFSDPDEGDIFSLSICRNPVFGVVEHTLVNEEICLTYTPLTGYNGPDNICVRVCDMEGACDERNIPILVGAINPTDPIAPPQIAPIAPITISNDTVYYTCTAVTRPNPFGLYEVNLCSPAVNGIASASIFNGEVCLNYIPNEAFVGTEIICLELCDQNGNCGTTEALIKVVAPIPVEINLPPTISPQTVVSLLMDSTGIICTTFSDPNEGDTFMARICEEPTNGIASISIVNQEICIDYQPNSQYVGEEAICISVCDQDNACAETIINIIIIPDTIIPDTIIPDTIICAGIFDDIKLTNNSPICAGTSLLLSVENPDESFIYDWYYETDNRYIGSGKEVSIDSVDIGTGGIYYMIPKTAVCDNDINTISLETEVVVDVPSKELAITEGSTQACDPTIMIDAIVKEEGIGTWRLLEESSGVVIEQPNQYSTVVSNLATGSNFFIWSIESGSCGITSADTLEVNYGEAPIAIDDNYAIAANDTTDLHLTENDQIPFDEVNIYIVSDLLLGRVERNGSGLFSYIPNENAVGQEVFTYRICNTICTEACTEATATLQLGANIDCFGGGLVSPNDDGYNDTFLVPCLENYEGSALTIFNRYGDEVYHTLDYQNNWDGTYEGNPLPAGTYFFILLVNDSEGTTLKDYIFLQR